MSNSLSRSRLLAVAVLAILAAVLAGTVLATSGSAARSVTVVKVVKNQKLTILETSKQRPPADTAQYCDLIKNPNENKQFEVKI